jgi:hypothetical protein
MPLAKRSPSAGLHREKMADLVKTTTTQRERAGYEHPSRRTTTLGFFKYYIHDGTRSLCFQLIGDLSEAHVLELSGCFNTAKSTLSSRSLIIDLRSLRSADKAGQKWLFSMAHEGAQFVQGSYCLTVLGFQPSPTPRNLGIRSRLITIIKAAYGRLLAEKCNEGAE